MTEPREPRVLPLDPESERLIAAAMNRVRLRAHDARIQRHGAEIRLTFSVDEGGKLTPRSRIDEPLSVENA